MLQPGGGDGEHLKRLSGVFTANRRAPFGDIASSRTGRLEGDERVGGASTACTRCGASVPSTATARRARAARGEWGVTNRFIVTSWWSLHSRLGNARRQPSWENPVGDFPIALLGFPARYRRGGKRGSRGLFDGPSPACTSG
jgi:hypothetical protein